MIESVLQRFGHVKRMERDRIINRVYVGECANNCLLGRPRKRWNDTVNECLRKRVLDVKQGRKTVQVRSEWVCKGECMGHSLGDELLTLTRCYS